MSPLVSLSAVLQSIMPAPVDSRSSLTICALIFAITYFLDPSRPGDPGHARLARGERPNLFGRQFLGLYDPAIDAAGQSDLFADVVRGLRIELGDLREVEDAEVVELLLDRRRHAGQLLEIVCNTARARQLLEAEIAGRGRGRNLFLHDRLFGSAGIDAHFTLRGRNSVDRRLGNEVAVERDGAAGVVVARHDVSDARRIAVGIDDGSDRNVETLGFLDRNVFLVGVDHEQKVWYATHVLDAAERAIELVALALHREALFLGVAAGLARTENFIELAQPRNRAGNRFPVGQRAAEPARIDVVLRRTLGRVRNRILRLALGADEQDAAAFGDGVAHRLQRAMEHRHSL